MSLRLLAQFDRARDQADYIKRQTEALNISGLAESAGLITSNVGATRSSEVKRIKKEKEKREFTQAVLDAARRIAEIDAQLDKLYKIGEEIDQDIKDTSDRIKALDIAIANPSAIEIDADGNIVDPKIAAAVEDYKKRTGKNVDPSDTDTLLAILVSQREYEQGVLGGHVQRKQDNDSKISGLLKQRAKEVEVIQRENPDADVEALLEEFKRADDAVAFEAESAEYNSNVSQASQIAFTDELVSESEDEFEYDPFADTLDGESETFRKSTDLDGGNAPEDLLQNIAPQGGATPTFEDFKM